MEASTLKRIIPLLLCLMAAPPSMAAQADLALRETPVVLAVRDAAPAVVNISAEIVTRTSGSPFAGDPFFDRFFRDFFGDAPPRERRERSLGSGVIVDPEGYIVTNHHVIENADEIEITLSDNRSLKAEVVGSDPGTDSDLNAYDVVYYAGDCNAGSKTIAINLPNDERVREAKGSKKVLLKNVMQAKYELLNHGGALQFEYDLEVAMTDGNMVNRITFAPTFLPPAGSVSSPVQVMPFVTYAYGDFAGGDAVAISTGSKSGLTWGLFGHVGF